MGFGILFLGYFTGMVMFLGYLSVLRLLGAFIMLFAAFKLRTYNKAFALLLWACVVNIVFYGFATVLDVLGYVGSAFALGDAANTVMAVLKTPMTFALNMCMLVAIRSIAKETQSQKLFFSATRNIVFYCILFALELAALLPYELTRRLSVPAAVCSLVLSVLNMLLIFGCYARICDSEDAEMERKPSRFSFVNKFREEEEQRRQDAEKKRAERKKQRDKR